MTKQYKQPEEVKVDEPTLNEPSYLNTVIGSIETIIDTTAGSDLIPTGKPNNLINQVKIYKNTNTGTYRFYVYDARNDIWKYTSLS